MRFRMIALLGFTTLTAPLTTPSTAMAENAKCESVWLDYNECLMEAGSCLGRRLCDLAFVRAYGLCVGEL